MANVLLIEIGIALTAIALAGALANRISLSVIPAYILVGILIGPHEPTSIAGFSLQLVENREVINLLAELGIVFLLFFLGLEFSINQLLEARTQIGTIGFIDFLINFGLGISIGVVFGWSLLETLFLAGIIYISSSAVITKSLLENGWIANPESSPILGTLVFEDILIAIYLAILSAVAFGGGDIASAAVSIGTAFIFLGVLTVIAWYGTGLVERLFSTESDEQFLLRVLGVTILIAGAALASGVSEAVAAFFVGTAFSQTNHLERVERVISPARDLFAAIFFLSIGLTTDITVLADVVGLLIVAVVLSVIGKIISGAISGRIYGLSPKRSFRVGLGMVPRGEFSLVIAALAGGISGVAFQSVIPAFTVGYVLFMSIIGTVLIQHADRITETLVPFVTQFSSLEDS
ncbi:cation:proton antiporter [Haladaptatus sp. AB643]|uniref:cation:proton antiporter n=1 Tax=Haladaptatus sp. AB643 TaxID=2934174 RepID=UPI00209C2DE1|nr:cation:proton antiporter [Haladaptatus sp. AB643]MCO8245319.1 cation:proton antiporter [Haladaptatus sp. AB643]